MNAREDAARRRIAGPIGRSVFRAAWSRRGFPVACRAIVLAPIFALGCGLQPVPIGDADRPLDRDLAWTRIEAAPDPAATELLESGSGLSVDAAIALALRTNHDLRALRAERGVFDAQLLEAGRLPDPELDLRALASGAAEVSLLLDVLQGAATRSRRVDAANEALDRFDLDVAAAEWTLACDVRDAWLAASRAFARLGLLRRSHELAKAEAESARKMHDVGAGSIVTAIDAETAAIEIALSLVEAQAEWDAARGSLLRLASLPPSLELRLAPPEPESAPPEREAAFRHMRESRVDLRQIEASHRAARAELALARGERWPLPAFGPTIESDAESGIDPGFEVTWTLPLFSGNRGAIAAAAARATAAAQEYVALLASARADVDLALRRVESTATRARAYREELVPRSRRLVELVDAAADRGEVSRLEALRRRREALAQELAALDAEYEARASRAALTRAIGP